MAAAAVTHAAVVTLSATGTLAAAGTIVAPMGVPWTVNSRGNALKWLNRVIKKSGLPKEFPDGTTIDFHAFRHSTIRWMMEAGASLDHVAAIVGHLDVNITRKIYGDDERLPKRNAADSVVPNETLSPFY